MFRELIRRPRVLLVEDSPFLRYAFAKLLRLEGFDVLEASDGHEALASVSVFRPQLIVTDLHLPLMNGIELIRQIRSNPITSQIPVLALTADASQATETRAREAGALEYLTKPIDLPELLQRMRSIKIDYESDRQKVDTPAPLSP